MSEAKVHVLNIEGDDRVEDGARRVMDEEFGEGSWKALTEIYALVRDRMISELYFSFFEGIDTIYVYTTGMRTEGMIDYLYCIQTAAVMFKLAREETPHGMPKVMVDFICMPLNNATLILQRYRNLGMNIWMRDLHHSHGPQDWYEMEEKSK